MTRRKTRLNPRPRGLAVRPYPRGGNGPALRKQRQAIQTRMMLVSAALDQVAAEGISTGYAVDLLNHLYGLTAELENHLDSLNEGLAWSPTWRRNQ